MTTFTQDQNSAKYQIRSYKPGVLKVNEQLFYKSLIITPDQLIENWPPQSSAELSLEMFDPVIELKPDVLLIGTGPNFIFLDVSVYGELINQGIGVEIMDTSAACRTYNALTAENRNVVAALII